MVVVFMKQLIEVDNDKLLDMVPANAVLWLAFVGSIINTWILFLVCVTK
jgi:hypothetical protein